MTITPSGFPPRKPPRQQVSIPCKVDAVVFGFPQQCQKIVEHGVSMLGVILVEEALQAADLFGQNLCAVH